ncbi:N-acetylmuramoyl-L-alanine amidase [Hellea sp.]|nr:N-acetylmuramoyl-L-alanine amidase [Hellea sp.]
MLRNVVTLLLTLFIWGGFTLCARAQTLTNISYDEQRIVFQFSSDANPQIFAIGDNKPRIVIDVTHGDMNIGGKTFESGAHVLEGQGAVKRIRIAARDKGFRAVMDLNAGITMTEKSVSGSNVMISLSGSVNSKTPKSAAARPEPVSGPRYFDDRVPYPRLAPRGIVKVFRKPVIVIDPGHGGRDPGAIGIKGTHEKLITSASAKELQRQLLATGRYKVMLTRSKDKYVEHEERLRIARAGGADLFISIHADSAGNKSARGASVYTLADRAKNRSKRIVNSQNWIMDVDLTAQSDPVGDILVDLAQRSTSTQSEAFADILINELGGSTQLVGNSHRRAGYYVLLAPDVPAVLLEMGFLSNAKDEKLLKSANHRKKVLKSVTRSINKYFDNKS